MIIRKINVIEFVKELNDKSKLNLLNYFSIKK